MKSFFATLRSCPDLLAPCVNGILFIIALAISQDRRSDIFESQFFVALIGYVFAAVYFFARVVPAWHRTYVSSKPHGNGISPSSAFAIFLSSAFISCFTLNRSMNVFDESVLWYSIFIVIYTVALALRSLYNEFGKITRVILDIILGIGSLLMLYLTVTLSSWYILGAFGILALGISLHVFIPLAILIHSIATVIKRIRQKSFVYAYFGGIILGLIPVTVYCVQWKIHVDEINEISDSSLFNDEGEELPSLIETASKFPMDAMSQKILKTGIVYNTFESLELFSMDFNRINFNEPKRHDPLVSIADNVAGSVRISKDERIELLNFLFRARHMSESKFWDGDAIRTSQVRYDTQLFPEYRLAYTELLVKMQVDDKNKRERWGQQEALYTFYLPSGTAVTSLSLWVDGKEQKSVLTTKSKADSAYSDIVGVQFRDPSVVHWKEGNTITVRVFPVTYDLPRQIRIGFTSPLKKVNDKLRYENIPFQGPDAIATDWEIHVETVGKSGALFSSLNLETQDGEYVSDKTPDENWYIETDVIELNRTPFVFNGFTYAMHDNGKPVTDDALAAQEYILDVNKAWTKTDLQQAMEGIDKDKIKCWNGKEFIDANNPMFNEWVERKLNENFSLFPFYELDDADKSIVITKGDIIGPFLEELKKSEFSDKTKAFFQSGKRPHVYCLNGNASIYMKTLAEFRLLTYAEGSMNGLHTIIKKNAFPTVVENDSLVYIPSSNVSISKTSTLDSVPTKAPDHIMRLYAYNQVMRTIGVSYFDEEYELEKPVQLASEAHVVSPVSSLIVLETKEDYEKFDIEQDQNGLGNASKKNAGAVPEPHEWILIILTLAAVGYYFIRKRKVA